MKGIKALQAREPGSIKRLPITADLLLEMNQSWEGTDQDWDKSMLWAAVTMCFLGSGEITDGAFDEGAHLTFSDVAVDCIKNSQLLKIRLKASKMDPFRLGLIGKTGEALCPVSVVMGARAGSFFLRAADH
jgi:hypothetical protein